MSTSIHGVVEFKDITSGHVRWGLGEIFFPSSYTDIQEYLGMHDSEESMVPRRGHPAQGFGGDGTSSDYNAVFTALVIRGEALKDNYVVFDEHGQFRESDGVVLNEAGAERWLSVGARWLDADWRGDYRRISDPDMRDVNYITYKEYKAVIDRIETEHPGINTLGPHKAALAAMKALKKAGHKGVRFVYGGS